MNKLGNVDGHTGLDGHDGLYAGGIKGFTTRSQRLIYKTLIGLGLVWQF